MKVYFNENGTINRIPDTDTVFFKNSGNFNYIYLYGLPESQTVKVSYKREDRKRVGPYQASYGTDSESEDCVIVRIPAEALKVAGQLEVSIIAEHDEIEGEETITVTQAFAKIACTVFDNDAVITP